MIHTSDLRVGSLNSSTAPTKHSEVQRPNSPRVARGLSSPSAQPLSRVHHGSGGHGRRNAMLFLGPLLAATALVVGAILELPLPRHVAFIFGCGAGMLTVSFPALQLLHVKRHGAVDGISATAWLLLFWIAAAWAVHGVMYRDSFQMVVNFICLPLAGFVLRAIHRERPLSIGVIGGSCVLVTVSTALTVAGGLMMSAGAVLTISSMIGLHMLHQLMTSRTTRGFSSTATMASSGAQLMWLLHGLAEDKRVVAAHAVVVIFWNSLALCVAVNRHRR